MSDFDIATAQRETRFEHIGFEVSSISFEHINDPVEIRDDAVARHIGEYLVKEFDNAAEAMEFIEWYRAYLRDAFDPMNAS